MRMRQYRTGQRSTIAVISVALGMGFGIRRAHAQNAEAESLFSDGNKLMAARKFPEACAAFEASNRVEQRAGTLIRLGECRENNHQLASAWSAYKDARNLATDPRKRQFATTRAAALERRLSYLTVTVSDQNRLADLALTRNGTAFDAMLWNRALPVDGGDYVIAARAPGYEAWQHTIHVPTEGGKLTVDVPALTRASTPAVPEPSQPPASANAPAASPTSPVAVPMNHVAQQNVNVAAPRPSVVVSGPDRTSASQDSTSVVPFVVGAGALGLLGGGLGGELWAESRYDAAKSEMTSQSRRDALYSAANTDRHIAEAMAVGGLAAGGVAVWLYLRDRGRERGSATGPGVGVVPTTTGLALAGRY